MNGFALLWGKILDSSIWVKESKETRLVWITMLAMKNADGKIQASIIGLADRAKVTVGECREALGIFLSPDPDDTSGVEGGRRIREIPGGWEIVNHDLYRFSTEAKREFWRQSKAEQRAKTLPKRAKTSAPSGREKRFVRALDHGDTATADAIASEGLPDTIPSEQQPEEE